MVLVFGHHYPDVQLFKLLVGDDRRCLEEWVDGGLGFRERDNFAYRLLSGKNGDQPVETEAHSAMRRGAVCERGQQLTEPILYFVLAVANDPKHSRLDIFVVDADAS